MKILLCQPPVEDFYSTPDRHYPLGLLSLAGYLLGLPVEIKIVDFLHNGGRKTIPLPENFAPLEDFLSYDTSPVKIFHQYYHFGTDWEDMAGCFRKESPDIIAISSLFYTYSYESIKTARLARASCPDAVIVMGGQNIRYGLTSFNEDIPADYLIAGEGEIPFRMLVECLLDRRKTPDQIPGLYQCIDGKFRVVSRHMPCTPAEDIHTEHALIRTGDYTIGGLPAAMIQTSRGCPFGCTFCTIEQTFGRKIRYRPVPAILKEIEDLTDRGVQVLDFEDDNLTVDRDFAITLFSGIKEKYGNSLCLYAMNGLSSWTLDKALLELMREAGFAMLNLSVGTLAEQSLRKTRRVDSREAFENAAVTAAALGMKVMGYFIAGIPGETVEETLETLAFLSHLPVVAGISPFYYIPGQSMSIPRIPSNPRDARLSRFYPADSQWSEKELITLFRLTRWVNYVKEKMSNAGIQSCTLKDLPRFFSGDPVITELVNNFSLIGYRDRKKKDMVIHEISQSTVIKFKNIVQTIITDLPPKS
jgi:anaerobic magnesium-protoporphyrin IX monomethyl ester cyclase